jgi:hypothetical protein
MPRFDRQFSQVTNDIRHAVDRMPEGDYDFTPTPSMRSFRDLAAHTAEVQSGMCGPTT